MLHQGVWTSYFKSPGAAEGCVIGMPPGSGMCLRNRTLATVQSGASLLGVLEKKSLECYQEIGKFIGSSYI